MPDYLFFPQANDLDKVLKLINIESPDKIKNEEYVQVYLSDIAPRQVRYYLHAIRYLGLLDEKKEFTDHGLRFRRLSSFSQELELIRIIISDEMVGTMYLKDKLADKLSKVEIAEMLELSYPGFSSETYMRRAGNIRSWLNWISSKFDYYI